jgi:anti-sigma factor RsiW
VLLAFGLGWLSRGVLPGLAEPSATLAKSRVEHEFVRQAGFAHAVYLPEKRHPVEVLAAEQEHLVQWLSKRLGRPLKIPNLESQGFALVGGRLLPGESGARAQFMFQNPQGQRITLYLGALDKAGSTDAQQATQFRFEPDASVPSFYWADQGFGYALSGQVDRTTLMALANSIYSQIS